MRIIKANTPGDELIDAKAGENVIEKLGYERLSWIRVVTEGPVDLTIKTQAGDDRRTTRKDPDYNCFATEKTAKYSNPSGTFGSITGLVFDEDTPCAHLLPRVRRRYHAGIEQAGTHEQRAA